LKKFLLLFWLLLGCKVEQEPFYLGTETYKMWQDFIKPTKKEIAWAQIPWLTTFYDGLVESDRIQKPLLLWVMNGHPLGCT
tara:strand:+ start:85 stop:327 length:243 start_codon:yes stop_codon:yes gene_type:complete